MSQLKRDSLPTLAILNELNTETLVYGIKFGVITFIFQLSYRATRSPLASCSIYKA